METKKRRNFIGNLAKSVIDFSTNPSIIGDSPKRKLLTKDGKLVEVPEHIILNSSKRKATQDDVNQWVDQPNMGEHGQ